MARMHTTTMALAMFTPVRVTAIVTKPEQPPEPAALLTQRLPATHMVRMHITTMEKAMFTPVRVTAIVTKPEQLPEPAALLTQRLPTTHMARMHTTTMAKAMFTPVRVTAIATKPVRVRHELAGPSPPVPLRRARMHRNRTDDAFVNWGSAACTGRADKGACVCLQASVQRREQRQPRGRGCASSAQYYSNKEMRRQEYSDEDGASEDTPDEDTQESDCEDVGTVPDDEADPTEYRRRKRQVFSDEDGASEDAPDEGTQEASALGDEGPGPDADGADGADATEYRRRRRQVFEDSGEDENSQEDIPDEDEGEDEDGGDEAPAPEVEGAPDTLAIEYRRSTAEVRHLGVVVVDGVEARLVLQAEHEDDGVHPGRELQRETDTKDLVAASRPRHSAAGPRCAREGRIGPRALTRLPAPRAGRQIGARTPRCRRCLPGRSGAPPATHFPPTRSGRYPPPPSSPCGSSSASHPLQKAVARGGPPGAEVPGTAPRRPASNPAYRLNTLGHLSIDNRDKSYFLILFVIGFYELNKTLLKFYNTCFGCSGNYARAKQFRILKVNFCSLRIKWYFCRRILTEQRRFRMRRRIINTKIFRIPFEIRNTLKNAHKISSSDEMSFFESLSAQITALGLCFLEDSKMSFLSLK
ncbi:Protein of unknown function [Gryllus bimaculatus]|nr:Protein of unknown function [Gryllus bimaculatus]